MKSEHRRRGEKAIFHINMLRQWHEKERPVEQNCFVRAVGKEEEVEEQYFPVKQEGHRRRCHI